MYEFISLLSPPPFRLSNRRLRIYGIESYFIVYLQRGTMALKVLVSSRRDEQPEGGVLVVSSGFSEAVW